MLVRSSINSLSVPPVWNPLLDEISLITPFLVAKKDSKLRMCYTKFDTSEKKVIIVWNYVSYVTVPSLGARALRQCG